MIKLTNASWRNIYLGIKRKKNRWLIFAKYLAKKKKVYYPPKSNAVVTNWYWHFFLNVGFCDDVNIFFEGSSIQAAFLPGSCPSSQPEAGSLRRETENHQSRVQCNHLVGGGESFQTEENCLFLVNCWRALARQQPILYNSEKKPKFVRCKIGDMRSWLCFYSQAFRDSCERTQKYWSISSNSPAQLKDTINEVKYGYLVEVFMTASVITLKDEKRFLFVWLLY